VSKVLSPRPGPAVNQSAGLLYNKIRSKLGRGSALPTIGKYLFVDLVERIVKELNPSNCSVCGGTLKSKEWPWKGTGLNAYTFMVESIYK
jgi:hypothetical protein